MNSPSKSNKTENSSESNINWLKEEFESDKNNEINFNELIKSLLRRKKLFGFAFLFFLIASSSITILQLFLSPVYKGGFKLLVASPLSQSEGAVAETNDFSTRMLLSATGNMSNNNMSTLIQFLKSPYVLKDLSDELGIDKNKFAKMINIEQIKDGKKFSEVLNITLETKNPKRGLNILNKLSDNYIKVALVQKQRTLSAGLKFLESQEPAIRLSTKNIKDEISKFQEENSVLFPLEEGQSLKLQQKALLRDLKKLEITRDNLIDLKELIQSGKITIKSFLSRLENAPDDSLLLQITDPSQSLFNQMKVLEEKLALDRLKFSENSKIVQGLLRQKESIKPKIVESQINAIDNALRTNIDLTNALKKQLSDLENQFQRQPKLIKEYETLNQKLQIAVKDLIALENVKKSYQTNLAQSTEPWLIISPPEISLKPIKPSIPRDFLLGGIISFLIAGALSLWRDRIDNVFHSLEELKENIKAPLLGSFPHVSIFSNIRENKGSLIKLFSDDFKELNDISSIEEKRKIQYERFLYQESLRNIYTSFKFINIDKPIKSISITSSISSEGKSLIVPLFAKTLCDLGLKVLLVDADMRLPQSHDRLGLNNLVGLSNLLSDQSLNRSKVTQQVPNCKNFDVITAGVKPPDTAKILSSQKMKDFVEEVSNSNDYDLIIFDTPPIYGLSDASLISEHVDGVVLIVTLENVDKKIPVESIRKIMNTRSTFLGVISNQIKENKNNDENNYGGYYDAYVEMDDSLNLKKGIKDKEETKTDSNKSLILKLIIEKLKVYKLKFNNFINYLDN